MRSILVGIPVIYCEDCVYQCIKSVESQADEVFIIDNNSTVGIKEIISGKNVLTNSSKCGLILGSPPAMDKCI